MPEENKVTEAVHGGGRPGAGRKKAVSVLDEDELDKAQIELLSLRKKVFKNLKEDLESKDSRIRQATSFKLLDKFIPEKIGAKNTSAGKNADDLKSDVLNLLLGALAGAGAEGNIGAAKEPVTEIVPGPDDVGGVQVNTEGGLLPAEPEAVIVSQEPGA